MSRIETLPIQAQGNSSHLTSRLTLCTLLLLTLLTIHSPRQCEPGLNSVSAKPGPVKDTRCLKLQNQYLIFGSRTGSVCERIHHQYSTDGLHRFLLRSQAEPRFGPTRNHPIVSEQLSSRHVAIPHELVSKWSSPSSPWLDSTFQRTKICSVWQCTIRHAQYSLRYYRYL